MSENGEILVSILKDEPPVENDETFEACEEVASSNGALQNYLETFNSEIEQNGVDDQSADESELAGGNYIITADDTGGFLYHAAESATSDMPELDDIKKIADVKGEEVSFPVMTVNCTSVDENGELNYVMILQPKEGEDVNVKVDVEERGDLSAVYDFDEEAAKNAEKLAESEEEEDNKLKIVKVNKRKQVANNQPHMCPYCNYTSGKRYLLMRHLKSHSEERPHKCSVCDRGFKTIVSLTNHTNTHTGIKPHSCKHCKSSFTTSGELVRHVRYKHTHEKPHKCSLCQYASVELSKMRNHMRCHTGERPYQCPHCTYASPDSFKLKRHLRTHTGERPYECETCHLRFTQSNSLKAHRITHISEEEKPQFKCTKCPASCGRKTDLRIHMQKLHSTDQSFTCRRCGTQFSDRYNFKMHTKTHDGEKCWKCDLCSYASTSHRHLESHMLIHTDEKPFACDMCELSFRQKQLLRRHKNLYHNPDYVPPAPKEKNNECGECHRVFRHKGNLIRHMSVHDPETMKFIREATIQRRKVLLQQQLTAKKEKLEGMDEEGEEEGEEEEEDIMSGKDMSGVEEELTIVEDNDTVAGDEDQQFILLEFMEEDAPSNVEGEGEGEGDSGNCSQMSSLENLITEEYVDTAEEENSSIKEELVVKKPNCYGFDEEGEEEEVTGARDF